MKRTWQRVMNGSSFHDIADENTGKYYWIVMGTLGKSLDNDIGNRLALAENKSLG